MPMGSRIGPPRSVQACHHAAGTGRPWTSEATAVSNPGTPVSWTSAATTTNAITRHEPDHEPRVAPGRRPGAHPEASCFSVSASFLRLVSRVFIRSLPAWGAVSGPGIGDRRVLPAAFAAVRASARAAIRTARVAS